MGREYLFCVLTLTNFTALKFKITEIYRFREPLARNKYGGRIEQRRRPISECASALRRDLEALAIGILGISAPVSAQKNRLARSRSFETRSWPCCQCYTPRRSFARGLFYEAACTRKCAPARESAGELATSRCWSKQRCYYGERLQALARQEFGRNFFPICALFLKSI